MADVNTKHKDFFYDEPQDITTFFENDPLKKSLIKPSKIQFVIPSVKQSQRVLEPNLKQKSEEICNIKTQFEGDGPSTETTLKKSKGKFFYTSAESILLKDIKKLFKTKTKRTKIKSLFLKEKQPEVNCRIIIAAWAKHDTNKCHEDSKDFSYIGELIFPVCSQDIFYKYPGVPVRRSKKSFTINDPATFGKEICQERPFAFPDKVLPDDEDYTKVWTYTKINESDCSEMN